MIEVLGVGLQATIQDLGRPGYGHLGVPEAGAADGHSLRLANRLVGNGESSACIEALLGGLTVRFETGHAFALTGATCTASLDELPIGMNAWTYARSGQVLTLSRPDQGLRTYLAIAGGIEVAPVLGSRSTDTLSGIGPPVLQPGTHLPIGRVHERVPPGADVVVSPTVGRWHPLDVAFQLGPRDDLFPSLAIDALLAGPWQISPETDRVAARLLGPALLTSGAGQLPTEGLAAGSIQVPSSGQPIVHLANHPPTGGYPVIGVVARREIDRIAQAVPGTSLRFVLRPPARFD